MKHKNRLILSLFVMAFLSTACGLFGSEGEFHEGYFRISCVDQLPSLCERSPLPPLAVGTDIQVYYEPDAGGYSGEVHAVSNKLFSEAAWSVFYCGDNRYLYDYTRIYSEEINEIDIVSTGSDLDDPIQVGCDGDFPINAYVVPIGTSSRQLMGIGSWHADVVPAVANVSFDGNEITLTSINDSDVDVAAVLTLTSSDGSGATDFDLRVCASGVVVDGPVETVDQQEDTAEAADVVDEDVTEDPADEDIETETEDMPEAEEDSNG